MTSPGLLATLVVILLAGDGLARLLGGAEREFRRAEFKALSLLLGTGYVSLAVWLFGLVLSGFALVTGVIIGATALAVLGRTKHPSARHEPLRILDWLLLAILAAQAVFIVWWASRFALGWDGLMIWEFKARLAVENRGVIPPAYFSDADRVWSHPYYPLGLPGLETWLQLCVGGVNQAPLRLIGPLYYFAAVALIVTSTQRLGGTRRTGLLAAVAFFFVPYFFAGTWGVLAGYADFPLGVLFLAALIYLPNTSHPERSEGGKVGGTQSKAERSETDRGGARGQRVQPEGRARTGESNPAEVTSDIAANTDASLCRENCETSHAPSASPLLCGAFAALCVWEKSEGRILWLTLVILAAFTLLPRKQWRVWLTVALPGAAILIAFKAFLAARHTLTETTYLPATPANILAHTDRLIPILTHLARELANLENWGLIWPGVALALVALILRGQHQRALQFTLALLLPLAGYLFAFVLTSWSDYESHMALALPRLLLQLTPAAILLIALAVPPHPPKSPTRFLPRDLVKEAHATANFGRSAQPPGGTGRWPVLPRGSPGRFLVERAEKWWAMAAPACIGLAAALRAEKSWASRPRQRAGRPFHQSPHTPSQSSRPSRPSR